MTAQYMYIPGFGGIHVYNIFDVWVNCWFLINRAVGYTGLRVGMCVDVLCYCARET